MQRRAALVLVVITPALLITLVQVVEQEQGDDAPAESVGNGDRTRVDFTRTGDQLFVDADPAAASRRFGARNVGPRIASAPASPSASPTPTPTPSASASPTPTPSGSPVNLDPCQLVTQDEASTLAKVTYGPGKEETTQGGGKECVYGSQTTNVMDVIVGQAATPAQAHAEYVEAQAEVQITIATRLPAGVHVNLNTANTEGIGDQAATVTGSETLLGKPISFTGVYVLSGSTFFTIGDLVVGTAPPTVAAVQDQAKVTLGRI